MRNATAALRRQALFAAAACAVLAGALSAVPGTVRFRAHADAAFDPPIAVRSVAFDRTPAVNEAKASRLPIVQASTQTPAPAKTQTAFNQRACNVSACRRLAALPPTPPRRPAALSDAVTVTVALTTIAPAGDKSAHSLSDRLLSPVGNLRDRFVGLISSL
jgi:hypothetical protein